MLLQPYLRHKPDHVQRALWGNYHLSKGISSELVRVWSIS